jgi:hypothetical protein
MLPYKSTECTSFGLGEILHPWLGSNNKYDFGR